MRKWINIDRISRNKMNFFLLSFMLSYILWKFALVYSEQMQYLFSFGKPRSRTRAFIVWICSTSARQDSHIITVCRFKLGRRNLERIIRLSLGLRITVSGMRIITLDETDSASKRMHISYNLICHARDMRRRIKRAGCDKSAGSRWIGGFSSFRGLACQ